MNIEKVTALLKKGESTTVEFKKSTALLRPAFETICAFLNGHGGTVLIGVNDKGQPIGQDVTDNTRREIAKEKKKIEPTASIDIDYIEVKDNKFIIVIHVNAGDHSPYIYDGRAFQRDESSTNRTSQHCYEQLLVKRGQLNHSWEEVLVTDYEIGDLDHEEINRTIADGVHQNRIPVSALKESTEQALKRLGLSENKILKRSAIVLFAKELFPKFMQCMISMARFKGSNKLGDFIDNQQIYGNPFRILTEADVFLRRHLPIASFFKTDSFERIDKPILPILAIREALINAICHRDYTDQSASISLAIYDDRLEIWNNGSLPKPLKIADLKRTHASLPRNKLISKVFHVRGLIETWGTGTNKMISLCKKEGIRPPLFREYSGGLSVTFRFKEPIGVTYQTKIIKPTLSLRQEALLSVIKKYGAVTLKQIISELENPPPARTIRSHLNSLKQKGLIANQGAARNTLWILKN